MDSGTYEPHPFANYLAVRFGSQARTITSETLGSAETPYFGVNCIVFCIVGVNFHQTTPKLPRAKSLIFQCRQTSANDRKRRLSLGKVAYYHYTNPAYGATSRQAFIYSMAV